jgi:hypothetical protein
MGPFAQASHGRREHPRAGGSQQIANPAPTPSSMESAMDQHENRRTC